MKNKNITTKTGDDILSPIPRKTLRMAAFGGIGEIGMNMSMLEYEGKIVIIDCGQTLPDDSLPGVDVVVPDVSYLQDRQDDILGIVITHGHEDHIGGLSYLAPKIGAPKIHAPLFASEIIKRRFQEIRPNPRPEIAVYERGSKLKLGPFEFEFISVTHSMPNAFALGIHTPIGTIVWSGDFKIDPNGQGDDIFDLHAFARLGDQGVLALFIDSTNANEPGVTGHEIDLVDSLDTLFFEASGSIFFSTFGSSVHRMQTVLDLADEHDRRVFVTGRSMKRNFEIACDNGFLDVPNDVVVDQHGFNKLKPQERLILCTGSQGEPMSALSRVSMGQNRQARLESGDMVMISARMIPGNERPIYRMVNHFHRRGARVITSRDAQIHCSGHAKRMELKQLIALCKPKHVIPVHGELRHQMGQRDNALDMGIDERNVHVIDRGDILHIDQKKGAIVDHLKISRVLVDGRALDGVEDTVIRDRQHLAEDGMLVVILSVDSSNGEFVQPPEIVTRGFVFVDDNPHIIDECRKVATRAFKALHNEAREEADVVKEEVRTALKRHIRKTYDRYPVILPMLMEL